MKPSFVIIGIGNPGEQYAKTRHNVGFRAIDNIAEKYKESEEKDIQKFLATGQEAIIEDASVLLLKPTTFVNLSINSVNRVVDFYKLNPAEDILIICDDIDLPVGELRLREKGGPGTHNGLRSIHSLYGDDFPRLRIGLGAPSNGEDLSAWVLSTPSPDEENKINKSMNNISDIVRDFVLSRL
ncbi:MAG: aminoacyl-tRNA hydrolase [Candidatus Peribacteraceae bacterium]|nr:aminoacyl-tRNA hydrolase [Candidatus Peribacteraceae bacterium]